MIFPFSVNFQSFIASIYPEDNIAIFLFVYYIRDKVRIDEIACFKHNIALKGKTMFEQLPLIEIQYSPDMSQNIFSGIQLPNQLIASEENLSYVETFLKDCRFVLDGTSLCTQFEPISPFAREHLLYIQSFSYWKARSAHYTRRYNLDSFLFCYTFSGCGELEYEGASYLLREGDAFLIDCRSLHTYHTKGDAWEHCILHFYGLPAERLYQDLQQNADFVFRPNEEPALLKNLNRLLGEYTRVDPYREYRVNALLTNFMLTILTATDSYRRVQENLPLQLNDLILYLNEHFNRDISLDALSSSFAISKYYLCRCFKQYTGYTINEYVNQLRMERAKELLRTTSLPAYQVGVLVGIADENYFYRLFKKNVGISPHRYRNNR